MEPQISNKNRIGLCMILAALIILAVGIWSGDRFPPPADSSDVVSGEGETPAQDDRPAENRRQSPSSGDIAADDTEASEPVKTQPASEDFILRDSSNRFYSREELAGLSSEQLYLAKNEIYARLGRKFKSETLDQYFRGRSWYQPVYDPDVFDAKGDGVFNQYELANRNLIVELENR